MLKASELKDCIERSQIIAAVQKNLFKSALRSPCEIIFHLNASLPEIKSVIDEAHACGADGIISTRAQLIRYAADSGLLTVQRFFALDSKGLEAIEEMLESVKPDLIEIIPGVIGKVIKRFSAGNTHVIAGGLIETKAEVTDALSHGADAVSTGMTELWYL